jgi:hypothetical protein
MSPLDAQGNYYAGDKARPDAALASAARTTSGSGAAFDTDQADSLEATLTVTAASGTTPTLDVRLETSIDGGTTWDTVGSFAQLTAASADGHVFGPLGDTCRWAWTIAGTTPSFTFTITAEANN